VQITLDGRWSRSYVTGDSTDVVVDALFDGEHILHIVRINEILEGLPLVLNTITLDGEDACLLDAPALPDRKMLFIGDSITCGFGLLSKAPGGGFKTVEQDGAHTYAALTAAHFQAQAHFTCISGRGIARNCDNEQVPLIPEFFEWTTVSNPTPWDHNRYQPDVIVVNAGTNDTAGEESPVDIEVFKSAAKAFIARLRTVYPMATIIWCYGMMATELHDALEEGIASMNGDRMHYCKFQTVWAFENEIGSCSHPRERAHRRCSGVLIDKICDVVGWDK